MNVEELSKLAFKGDNEAQNKLMGLGEEAAASDNFELAMTCFREAARAYKFGRYKANCILDDTKTSLQWQKAKVEFLKKHHRRIAVSRKYKHSFSPGHNNFLDNFERFWTEKENRYKVAFKYFCEVIATRGVKFSAPGDTPNRYLIKIIGVILKVEEGDYYTSWADDPEVSIALDEIITDFLNWAKKAKSESSDGKLL